MNDRTVLEITGPDRVDFLQGLITNDMARAEEGILYAALLTPQGKFVADFFVVGQGDRHLIDVASPLAPLLLQRLTMYRLRSDVQISQTDLVVSRGTGTRPDGAYADPRHDALGWRHYDAEDLSDNTDWDAVRVAHLIPESTQELTPDSYILETGFERLNGVDFRKGCFVGQEVVARMKHKTTLRKGLARVRVDGETSPGTEITADGKPIGQIHTIHGNEAIAYLRFDRSDGEMRAGAATLTRLH